MGYINKGKEEGATLLCGGVRYGDKGFWVEPTVFGDVKVFGLSSELITD